MQQGRGGMGSHKHGVSGTPYVNARMKAAMAAEDNDERARRQRRPKPTWYASVAEAFAAMRKRWGMP